MQVVKFNITTTAGGAYTSSLATAPGSDLLDPRGPYLLHAVEWVDGTMDDGATATLTVTDTASGVDLTLLTLTLTTNADAMYYPRVVENNNAGAALTTYTLPVVYGTLKLVVSAGGNAKTGACWVYLLEAYP